MDDDSRGLERHYKEKKLYSKLRDKFQGRKHTERSKKTAKMRCLRLLVPLGGAVAPPESANIAVAREAHHPTLEGHVPSVEK